MIGPGGGKATDTFATSYRINVETKVHRKGRSGSSCSVGAMIASKKHKKRVAGVRGRLFAAKVIPILSEESKLECGCRKTSLLEGRREIT